MKMKNHLCAFVLALFAVVVLSSEPAPADVELHGFGEARLGLRTQDDPFEDESSLSEARLQLSAIWYHDLATLEAKADLVYDDLAANREDLDLDNGHGFLDVRLANILFSPLSFMDVKAGRQVLTWGTGDLVFINDLFPKDWQSFFLGRDEEYLKAPSDALFVSLFPAFIGIDIAYMPAFDADHHITGERLSYWNGQTRAGQNAPIRTEQPDDCFTDDEIALRVYRNLGAYEAALYGYHGFWKSPGGLNPATGRWIFPELNVYGASLRGPLLGGIANLEAGYYDSAGDRHGADPFVNNSEARGLAGYEREIGTDLTMGIQYYLERMLHHDAYLHGLEQVGMGTETAWNEDRHTVTLRLTKLLMNQKVILGCFIRYSPSDKDAYLKPTATYKLTDQWQASLGGNVFVGEDPYTFLGQFEKNNNVNMAVRYSF